MKTELWIFTVSLLGAAWFFASGYFVAFAKGTLKGALSTGSQGDPAVDPQPDFGFSLEGVLQELARSYQTKEIAIFDSDGLLVQGQASDPQLALRVAGFARGRSVAVGSTDSDASVLGSDEDLGIHGLACQVQPLWLVMRGANRRLGDQDLHRLGVAFERHVTRAA